MNGVLKLDWLGFTFVPEKPSYENNDLAPINQFLNMFPEFKAEEFTVASIQTHYQHALYFDDMLISYNDLDDCEATSTFLHKLNMGVNVQVPAHSLSELYAMFGLKDDD